MRRPTPSNTNSYVGEESSDSTRKSQMVDTRNFKIVVPPAHTQRVYQIRISEISVLASTRENIEYPIFYIHVEPFIVGKLGYISQLNLEEPGQGGQPT